MWERACSRMQCVSQQIHRLIHRIREQARSHSLIEYDTHIPIGYKAAALLLLIWERPVKHAGRTQALERG